MDCILRWDRSVGERYPDLSMLRKSIWRGTLSENDKDDDNFPPRSLLWKVLLLYGTFDKKSWGASQERDLKRYLLLLEEYNGEIDCGDGNISNISDNNSDKNINNINDDITETTTLSSSPLKPSIISTRVTDDPLSQSNLFNDIDLNQDEEDLNDIIMRDVDRTFPDVNFFRDEAVKSSLHRILYIYAKQNKEVGYRQGMHELAGPMLWVMTKDSNMDDKYIESDAYSVFQAIMKNAKAWYLPPQKTQSSAPPIVSKSIKIQESILKLVDPEIYNILVANEIEPQIWGIRWIRLIFGREFGFHQTLRLWDALFAADGLTLELIDYICVTMLIRIRNIIIQEPHYAEILTTLLNYPTNPIEPPYLYIINALYLKSHLNQQGARYVFGQFEKYNQVETRRNEQLPAPPSPSLISPLLTIPALASSINLDSIRDAAKSVSKKLDIDRRVRDARDAFEKQQRGRETERNQALAELLSDSLNVLEKGNNSLQFKQALASIRDVKECLLNNRLPLPVSPEISEPSDSILLEVSPVMTEPPSPVKEADKSPLKSPVKTPVKATTTTPNESSPTRLNRTPIRTSLLANSDFAWMLDSSPPDIKSNFKAGTVTVERRPLRTKAADIFELS